ncbi:hypothetical protein FN846DRAFT_1005920 [Sphaerosporella brunnea]|uniref:Uncharacterized protein n=1 Tax=Sphaerosporella brunnea TaxID=1250544 RepID=A0A5J5F2R5_9PEZI|nr:hypothetical protein FN846DRAFT_1005920 [Sphaerosporella brunnea]
MRPQKAPHERGNSQDDQPNTRDAMSVTQYEQSEAQKQQADKERIRTLVNSFIFGTQEPISTLKDSNPVPGFVEGRAYAKELEAALPGAGGKLPARDPQLVAPTTAPAQQTFDLWVCIAPPVTGPSKADDATQREGSSGRLEVRALREKDAALSPESTDIVQPPPSSDLDEDGPAERARTPEVRMDLSGDGIAGFIGDPFVNSTPSRCAPGNGGTASRIRSVPTKATRTDTAYRPRPSSESRRLSARTRLNAARRTSRPRIRHHSEGSATHPPAGTRTALHSPPRKLPRMEMRTPTARQNNLAADLSRPTPPVPDVIFEKPQAAPPPAEAESIEKVLAFAGNHNIKLPM